MRRPESRECIKNAAPSLASVSTTPPACSSPFLLKNACLQNISAATAWAQLLNFLGSAASSEDLAVTTVQQLEGRKQLSNPTTTTLKSTPSAQPTGPPGLLLPSAALRPSPLPSPPPRSTPPAPQHPADEEVPVPLVHALRCEITQPFRLLTQ
eukprot:6192454-Pleurochrysis_carterae.AAC.3